MLFLFCLTIDDEQITHLICVRLKSLFCEFLLGEERGPGGGGSGFPVFPPFLLSCKHQKTSYHMTLELAGPQIDA